MSSPAPIVSVMPNKDAEDVPVLPVSSTTPGPEGVSAKQDAKPKDLATLTSDVARLEALMKEQQLRAELLNRAVGVPKPGASQHLGERAPVRHEPSQCQAGTLRAESWLPHRDAGFALQPHVYCRLRHQQV